MLTLHSTSSISRTIFYAAINFILLSMIFIIILMKEDGYTYDVFFKGINLALIGTALFTIVDILSGGFARLVMIGVYPLVLITMLILSIINPSYIHNGKDISLYKLWSISFWSWFTIGMVVAISFKLLLIYVTRRISLLTKTFLSDINTSILSNYI